jgi:hypothetical protein
MGRLDARRFDRLIEGDVKRDSDMFRSLEVVRDYKCYWFVSLMYRIDFFFRLTKR